MALYAPSGFAGALLFVAAGLGVAAWYWRLPALGAGAVVLAFTGAVLAFVGLRAGGGGGPAGTVQATVELFDLTRCGWPTTNCFRGCSASRVQAAWRPRGDGVETAGPTALTCGTSGPARQPQAATSVDRRASRGFR